MERKTIIKLILAQVEQDLLKGNDVHISSDIDNFKFSYESGEYWIDEEWKRLEHSIDFNKDGIGRDYGESKE